MSLKRGQAEIIMMSRDIEEYKPPQNDISDCEDDFYALKIMFDRMRADRDLWKEVAENLATELGKKEYADAEYENCKEAAQGVAW